ncbi:hypothetical protein C8J55DRAFT_504841 [Lentinula edodes]|uniref:Uncharacterized protein n=1 Tax=Lentinula lateritia TaxID=40482 RepID=A0A9W9DW02_9AGAR|nr:hypothetical protein C8J55DRAFT_504841 [Lentinula edodes]
MPPGTIMLRSPSPTLPGAWPHTPLRSRSLTYPTLTSGPDLMHLDTAHSQRKLTSSQPASLASDETLAQSATTGSMPSGVSELTNFTQVLSGSSISAMTKASLNTSTSTLEECMTAPSDQQKTASPNSETRIHQLPSPETSPDNHVVYTTGRRVKADQSQQQIVIEDESVDDTSRSSEMSSSPNPPFRFTPSQSRSESPMSPMIFVSPTASNRTPPAIRTEYWQSYSFSSDEDGEYDDSDLLRLGSPSLPASLPSTPRSPTFSSPARAWRQNVSVGNISPISEDLNSSTEGLQVSSQRRLTSLSLPGSINLDDSIPDLAPFPSRVTNEHTQADADWTLSLTGTSEPGFSPYTTSVTSPISLVARSISPSPSLRDRLQNPLVTHVVNFPSPAVTLPPSPDVPQANAGEYATVPRMP